MIQSFKSAKCTVCRIQILETLTRNIPHQLQRIIGCPISRLAGIIEERLEQTRAKVLEDIRHTVPDMTEITVGN